MAQRFVVPKNGLITIPTGAFGVYQSYTMTESQATEETTYYGSGIAYGTFAGSGTPTNQVEVTGFAQAGAASMSPGWGASTAAGASCTVTFDTSTTVTGIFIVQSIRATHARTRGAVGCTWNLQGNGDMTTAWATS